MDYHARFSQLVLQEHVLVVLVCHVWIMLLMALVKDAMASNVLVRAIVLLITVSMVFVKVAIHSISVVARLVIMIINAMVILA